MKKKVLALLLCGMVFPTAAFAAENTVTLPLDEDGQYKIPYYVNDDGEKVYPVYIDEDGDAIYEEDEPTDAEDLIENWEEATGKPAPQAVIDAAYEEIPDEDGQTAYSSIYSDGDDDAAYEEDESVDAEDLIKSWEESTGKPAPQAVIDAAYEEIPDEVASTEQESDSTQNPLNSIFERLRSLMFG